MTSFVIKATIIGGADEFSVPMLRAFNALRCAVSNFGENFWNLAATAWYLGLAWEVEEDLEKAVAEYYPYQCTCKQEFEYL